jgi:predicted nucleotidyltransferase
MGLAAIFSEEIAASDTSSGFSAKLNEMCQALAADFIIVIQASPGSIAEAHDFAEFIRDIGRKMLVFIDERAQSGYSFTGALQELNSLYKNVETYKYPKDIRECHLTRSVQKKVQTLQGVKWRANLK